MGQSRSAAGAGRDEGSALAGSSAQLASQSARLKLPWRESIIDPDSRLVWHQRSLTSAAAPGRHRVAFDPVTRWYFVVRAAGGRLAW